VDARIVVIEPAVGPEIRDRLDEEAEASTGQVADRIDDGALTLGESRVASVECDRNADLSILVAWATASAATASAWQSTSLP
jgi:hypothetical protein